MNKPDYGKYRNRQKIGTTYVLRIVIAILVIGSLAYLLVELFQLFDNRNVQ